MWPRRCNTGAFGFRGGSRLKDTRMLSRALTASGRSASVSSAFWKPSASEGILVASLEALDPWIMLFAESSALDNARL